MYIYIIIIGLLYCSYSKLDNLLLLYRLNLNREKSHILALRKTMYAICWVAYLMLYQKIYHNIVPIDQNKYDVHYIYHGQLYKIRIMHKKGPQKTQVLMIANDQLEDISEDIIPFMGPKQNFHNLDYQPCHFQQKELTFYLSDGRILTFGDEKDIKFD